MVTTKKKGGPKKRSVKALPKFTNPFKPGAGHMPPYLAGRKEEQIEFKRLLEQDVILENLILTGLRGVGKTVLLETFKPLAISEGWLWVGTDLSESVSVSDENLAIRLLSDLASVTSGITMSVADRHKAGFVRHRTTRVASRRRGTGGGRAARRLPRPRERVLSRGARAPIDRGRPL